jgi:hypothetical protein
MIRQSQYYLIKRNQVLNTNLITTLILLSRKYKDEEYIIYIIKNIIVW